MLSTDEFKAWAKDVVLLCHITTRIEGKKDDDLLGRKGGGGFPYIVALDAEGRVTATLEGGRDVAGFTEMMKKGAEYAAKKAKADLPAAEALELFLFDVEVGNLDLAGAREAAAKMKDLSDDQRKRVAGALLDKEIGAVLEGIRKGTPEEKQAAGKAFAEMWKAGAEPDPDGRSFQPYYILMLDHAEATKDVALFEKALGVVRGKFGDNPQAAGFFQKQDERLKKMKE
ncbi:MAG: hypothetical protein HUU06_07780 [Planctomycetaceae bacterium]|nr:hypothetical protein [Planctomycetaceae bacterium]